MFIGNILANETNTWMCLHPNGTLMAECDDQLDWYPNYLYPTQLAWFWFQRASTHPEDKIFIGDRHHVSSCLIIPCRVEKKHRLRPPTEWDGC